MGQNASQPVEHRADESRTQRFRDVITRRSPHRDRNTDEEWQAATRLLAGEGEGRALAEGRALLQRSQSRASRISDLLRGPTNAVSSLSAGSSLGTQSGLSRNSALGRTRSRIGNIFRADGPRNVYVGRDMREATFARRRPSLARAGMNSRGADYYPPRLPSIDLSSTFEHDAFTASEEATPPRSSGSHRRANLRFNAFRPDRPLRNLTSSLRRRRPSPQRTPTIRHTHSTEDQAAMLSRLLSIAAAATAATLMGDDHQALSEARSLTGGSGLNELGNSGEDGSFDGFLRALQNGRIASALRQGGGESDGEPREAGPLNFFRMFRFGTSAPEGANTQDHRRSTTSQDLHSDGTQADGRMVPVIIVGIRSISPGSNSTNSAADDLPPFIEALGNFPSPLPANSFGQGHDSIDSILRPPQNGTSFRHRRRANSMSGFGLAGTRRRSSGIDDRLDDQRSPDRRRERPWSVASTASTWDGGRHPPPATPASPSPELSRISSRNTTPSHSRPASFVANSVRDLAAAAVAESRRNSTLNRTNLATPLSSHTEETYSMHSEHSSTNLLERNGDEGGFRLSSNALHRRSDTMPNAHYPRFASGHPRRNGVVEPDHLPPLSRSSTSAMTDTEGGAQREERATTGDSRSWIIYVLGGSYPENHPILTTPSLFTENPTYEDMMLLSALLGPAKAPVASEDDVQSAGGIYNIEVVTADSQLTTTGAAVNTDAAKTAQLFAVEIAKADGSEPQPVTGRERIQLEAGQRCLVCLCDFEAKEVARKLIKCKHLFHKECIDHWLTQGRNSCPLCRGLGVDEKEKPASGSATEEADAVAGAQDEAAAQQGVASEVPPTEVTGNS